MSRSVLLLVIGGIVLGVSGLLVGGVLLANHLDGGCQDGAKDRLRPAYEEFKSYLNEVPYQSYEIITTCDSGDDDSFLEVQVRPSVAMSAVEEKFHGSNWKEEVDANGDSYYLTKRGGMQFQVYVAKGGPGNSSQVMIRVYPWYR